MNEFEDLLNSVSQVEPGDVVYCWSIDSWRRQANVAISGTGVEGVLALRGVTNDHDADINDLGKNQVKHLNCLFFVKVVGKDTDTVNLPCI